MTDPGTLRLATRGSPLARAQAGWVAKTLTQRHPGLDVELVVITTTGDADRSTPVTHLTELGAFVRAVQQAVLDDRADAAVHSCKDLPVEGPDGLIRFYPVREAPWDVLCGAALHQLPTGARVGTGSPRRASQLTALRSDLRVDDIRGNVDTRLAKVEAGEYDAVVLAEAGLRRLGRHRSWTSRFTLDQMVPAPAQGALVVEAGSGAAALVAPIDDPATRTAVEAEREVLALTHIGCRGALGAYSEPVGDRVRLAGFVDDGRGRRRASVEAPTATDAAMALCRELDLLPGEATPTGTSPPRAKSGGDR